MHIRSLISAHIMGMALAACAVAPHPGGSSRHTTSPDNVSPDNVSPGNVSPNSVRTDANGYTSLTLSCSVNSSYSASEKIRYRWTNASNGKKTIELKTVEYKIYAYNGFGDPTNPTRKKANVLIGLETFTGKNESGRVDYGWKEATGNGLQDNQWHSADASMTGEAPKGGLGRLFIKIIFDVGGADPNCKSTADVVAPS